MSRFGPLEARGGSLVIGDAGGHHAELTASALVLRTHQEKPLPLAWSRIEDVSLSVPETRFRLPGLATTLGLGVLGALSAEWNIGSDLEEGELRVTIAGGEVFLMPITRHHVGGYWAKSVRATSALLTRLVADPASRQLVGAPDRVIRLLASGR